MTEAFAAPDGLNWLGRYKEQANDEQRQLRRDSRTRGRSRPCWNAARPDGRPGVDGLGASACCRCRAADRKWSSDPHDHSRPAEGRKARTTPLSPTLASIFLFGWVSIATRYWLLAQRDRGVSFVGHASIGAKGDGTWPEPL